MSKKPKNFGGRPKTPGKVDERVHLGFRVTPQLKERLEQTAKNLGRSQSQEAEMRLERSFDRADLLAEIIAMLKDNPKVVKAIATALAKS